jgi:hypothetical protein
MRSDGPIKKEQPIAANQRSAHSKPNDYAEYQIRRIRVPHQI